MKTLATEHVSMLGMMMGTDAILHQEKHGQHALVTSSELPRSCDNETQELLEAWGVKFGEPTDDLFRKAELPSGWKLVPTDHSMWSHLVDHNGRERAGIFYKAAFYDRHARISANSRFRMEWASDYKPGKLFTMHIVDGRKDAVLHKEQIEVTEENRFDKYGPNHEITAPSASEMCRCKCCEWLDANRPGWRDTKFAWELP